MQARAAASLKTAVALREQQALDRIAQSEAAATKQVRDTAVDVALSATRALLREQVGAGRSEAMVDRGDRRAAAPPALSFRFRNCPHKINRGLPGALAARRGLFFACFSPPPSYGGGGHEGRRVLAFASLWITTPKPNSPPQKSATSATSPGR